MTDNKRVAKNTLVLYIRMFVTMAIGMWSTRLVLNALGFTDQGLYNVVGGFVGLFGLVTASVSGSIMRFLTYEIGRKDNDAINRVLQNSITVQWVLGIIILILGETIGLWFVNHKLVIPNDRIFAVNIVYQFSIGSIFIDLISSAQSALVIANEKMRVYAAISIIRSVLTLLIGIVLTFFGGDRLILYVALVFSVSLGIRFFYTIYCKRSFSYLQFKFRLNKDIFIPIFKFAGWNSIGTTAGVLRASGTSVLLNIFGGPIANTINGIANSVSNIVTIFVGDFTTAYSPQITKKYAAQEYTSLVPFLYQCSKFSFGLMSVMAVPIILNAKPLLILWLGKIPEGTINFVQLIIIYALIECYSRPLITAQNATGNIKNYQIIVGGILLLTIPLTYLFLKLDLPIYFAYISIIITSLGAFIARMIMLRGLIPFWDIKEFFFRVIVRTILSLAISFSFPAILHLWLPNNIYFMIIQCFISFIWSCGSVFFIACNKHERAEIIAMTRKIASKLIIKRG